MLIYVQNEQYSVLRRCLEGFIQNIIKENFTQIPFSIFEPGIFEKFILRENAIVFINLNIVQLIG